MRGSPMGGRQHLEPPQKNHESRKYKGGTKHHKTISKQVPGLKSAFSVQFFIISMDARYLLG
jgi:hypothetical protein